MKFYGDWLSQGAREYSSPQPGKDPGSLPISPQLEGGLTNIENKKIEKKEKNKSRLKSTLKKVHFKIIMDGCVRLHYSLWLLN